MRGLMTGNDSYQTVPQIYEKKNDNSLFMEHP